jgi:hypothetical protein
LNDAHSFREVYKITLKISDFTFFKDKAHMTSLYLSSLVSSSVGKQSQLTDFHVADNDEPKIAQKWGQGGPPASPHLVDHHGKVLTKPLFASIYLGNFWKTKKGTAEKTYYDNFAKDVVQSKYADIWREYRGGRGKFVGSTVSSTPAAPRQINHREIQSIVATEIKSATIAQPNGQTVYTVYLPPNTTLIAPNGATSRDGLGGYHGSFDLPNGKRAYYAAIAYSTNSNGINFTGKAKDNNTIVASHEWTEAVTDPDVNNGKLGWYDNSYGEIGDIPINMGMDLVDLYGYVDGYAVQKEWSNKDGKAEIVPSAGISAKRDQIALSATAPF